VFCRISCIQGLTLTRVPFQVLVYKAMEALSIFQSKWKSFLCAQDHTFKVQFDYTTEKVKVVTGKEYANRRSLLDEALPMEPLRHLLQVCLQNESKKRFVLIPIVTNVSNGPSGLLLVHHHATLKTPYAVRCDLEKPTVEQMLSLAKLDSILSNFFLSFNYEYVKATYPSTLNSKISQWLLSDKGTMKPFGTETYRQLYAPVMQNLIIANTLALLTYQLSSLSSSWRHCEKWLSKQGALDSLETLSNALESYTDDNREDWSNSTDDNEEDWSMSLEELSAALTSCQAQCMASNTPDKTAEQQSVIASLQKKLDDSLKLIEEQREEIADEQEASTYWRSKFGDNFHKRRN
jgi:hypothetical protein